jgi:hypothetical protein
MDLPPSILGKTIVDQLNARIGAPVLTIGADVFTRAQLARVKCFNFAAAARLSHLLTQELHVKDTKDLYLNISPASLAIPGLGAISLATIGAAFELKGLGNLSHYIKHHYTKGAEVVTFATMKTNRRDRQAAAAEKTAAATRSRSRRRQAHELRVGRHLSKSNVH